jgi:hypothetical protein
MPKTVALKEFVEPLMKELRIPQQLVHMLAQKIAYREGFAWGATVLASDAEFMATEIRAKQLKAAAAHKARKAAK